MTMAERNDLELKVPQAMNTAIEDRNGVKHVMVGALENLEVVVLDVVNDSKATSPHGAEVSPIT